MSGSPSPPRLVDVGANLGHSAFAGDLDAVLARAAGAGVDRIVVTGTSESESEAALDIARRHPGRLWATAGVHPHESRHWRSDSADTLSRLAAAPEVVAIGETGLDFNRDHSPRPDQERAFEAQLALAAETGLPAFMHERDAHRRFAAIVEEFRPRLVAAVIHCFTGTREELYRYLDLDLHVGITGWICDERRGLHLRRIVGDVPADRLLVETDSPYLVPRDLRPKPKGRRNEPAFLPHVASAVAAGRGTDLAGLAAATTGNACALFGLDRAGPGP